jgi:hypothetical protein
MSPRFALAALLVVALVGCGGGDDAAPPPSATDGTDSPATDPVVTEAPTTSTTGTASSGYTSGFDPDAVGTVTVEPLEGGNGAPVMGASGPVDPFGYVEEEYVLSGTAHALESAEPLAANGEWQVEPGETAPFTTRIVVRRPADTALASGDVMVEWMNVTAGFDNAVVWAYAAPEIVRSGWTYVAVSAQRVGIEGGGRALVDLSLKTADPQRYANLAHPGDAWSYDIFSQAGAAVRVNWEQVLGGVKPERVVAVGESQSAYRLATYLNAVAPSARVFDGYLVHSRGGGGAQLSQDPLPEVKAPDAVVLRDDLDIPVFSVIAETDVVSDGLGFVNARQPDTDLRRTWEMAGTAHADSYQLTLARSDDGSPVADEELFRSMIDPPASVYEGIINCDRPFNTGPHTYVLRAAIAALSTWVRTGEAPPTMEPIELDDDGLPVLDDLGIARGGVRTPHVDVPLAVLSGRGQTGESFCRLFGTTVPLEPTVLTSLYGDRSGFMDAWSEATDAAVNSGVLLEADAQRIIAAADTVTAETGVLPG